MRYDLYDIIYDPCMTTKKWWPGCLILKKQKLFVVVFDCWASAANERTQQTFST